VNISTVQFSHILETGERENLHSFLAHTVFVISHKNEGSSVLLAVLWYLPVDSPIIIVTNCPERERVKLAGELRTRLARHKRIYLVHQKDETIAQLFESYGVTHILGANCKVIDGKGEGMYIGTLCAYQLGYPRWIVFYDADNFVPSSLLEYTLAMSRLFMQASPPAASSAYDTLFVPGAEDGQPGPSLHNIRICWSSKPELGSGKWGDAIMGRCTRIVSPLFNALLEGWFGIRDHAISSSNAGEQGMTIETALTLRFSAGFSVETLQLLDLFFHASEGRCSALQQYQSQSPHFHEKKDDQHVRKMIEGSLGSFFYFEAALPDNVRCELQRVYSEMRLERIYPAIYPPLQSLPLRKVAGLMDRFALFEEAGCQDMLLVE
jgi:mannosyl-3-phosphoglycerate synthase